MATAVDPICKMEVDTDSPPGGRSDHEGTTYYFCAPGCKVAFDHEGTAYYFCAPGCKVAFDRGAREVPARLRPGVRSRERGPFYRGSSGGGFEGSGPPHVVMGVRLPPGVPTKDLVPFRLGDIGGYVGSPPLVSPRSGPAWRAGGW